jgi:hypothetical protein
MEIDDLCRSMENLIPLHDTQEEYRILQISRSMTIEELSFNSFLVETFNRYRRYLKYINLHLYKKGKLVYILIKEFITFECVSCNRVFLAAKCVVIDTIVCEILETMELESEVESEWGE